MDVNRGAAYRPLSAAPSLCATGRDFRMTHVSRRRVFTAIVTIIALLACVGYVVSPDALFYEAPLPAARIRRKMAARDDGAAAGHTRKEWDGGSTMREREESTDFDSQFNSSSRPVTRLGVNASTTTTEETRSVVTTTIATKAANAVEATTPRAMGRKAASPLRPKRLKISAHPHCGSHGFKVDPTDDEMPPWAEGSTPFPSELTLEDPEPTAPCFAQVTPVLRCYKKGTDLLETLSAKEYPDRCSCLPGYHGNDCGIPSPVWHAPDFSRVIQPRLSLRETARRIILAIPVNHELDLVSVRAMELGDAVSATLLAESDFTAAGEPKDRFFETKAREDPSFLRRQRNRTLLLRANTFPPKGCTDGWVADHFSRSFIGKEGLPRLHGLRDDDFFLLFDADEMPRRDVLEFLRLYDGYGEPIAFRLRWYVFGFFWESASAGSFVARPTRIEAGCSIGMLRRVYGGDPYSVRHEAWLDKAIEEARLYERQTGRRLGTFEIGSPAHPSGFHCSWCFGRDATLGLQLKLVSAQLADGPRWGNYQDRLSPRYLRRIVAEGEWFDGTKPFVPTDFLTEMYSGAHEDFAPSSMLRNFSEYSPFLVNPRELKNGTLMGIYREAVDWALHSPESHSERHAEESTDVTLRSHVTHAVT